MGAGDIFEDIIVENVSTLWKKTDVQEQEVQSPKQDKPKEEHTKTHCN